MSVFQPCLATATAGLMPLECTKAVGHFGYHRHEWDTPVYGDDGKILTGRVNHVAKWNSHGVVTREHVQSGNELIPVSEWNKEAGVA